MELKDFKISETFWTATGEWVCVDIGTKTIIAYKVSTAIPGEHWDCQDNVIFYAHDFDAYSNTDDEV